jgi:hypothetical protein
MLPTGAESRAVIGRFSGRCRAYRLFCDLIANFLSPLIRREVDLGDTKEGDALILRFE